MTRVLLRQAPVLVRAHSNADPLVEGHERPNILVVGGGISGLTAALRLAERGFPITLIERETRVGGMATHFDINGLKVQLGTHAWFGPTNFYADTTRLCEELGTLKLLDFFPSWTIAHNTGNNAQLANIGHSACLSWLPESFDVAPSILKIPWLGVSDKLRALIATYRLRQLTYDQLLLKDTETGFDIGRQNGYSTAGLETFNAATHGLSDQTVSTIGAAMFAAMHDVLFSRNGLNYLQPKVGLYDIFGEPMHRRLESLGARIITGASVINVQELSSSSGPLVKVHFEDKEGAATLEGAYCIVAAQPWDAKKMLPWVNTPWTTLQPVTPIYTIVMELSGPVKSIGDGRQIGFSRTEFPFSVVTVLSNYWPEYQTEQYKNKSVIHVEVGRTELLPANMSDDDLAAMVKKGLELVFPEIRLYHIERFGVHREKKLLYGDWTPGQFSKKPKDASERIVSPSIYCGVDSLNVETIGMNAAVHAGTRSANWVLSKEGLPLIEIENIPIPGLPHQLI